MTPWQQTFENSQFVGKIDQILETLKATPVKGLDAQQVEQFARLDKALRFIRGRLKSVDPELLSQASINNLGSWLANISNQLQTFSSSRSFGYIQNANTNADQILDVVRAFRITAKDSEHAAGAATTAFRDKALEEIEHVRKGREAVDSDVAAQKDEIAKIRADLTETKRTIEQQKSRLDQSIATFQKQFSDSEANRAKEFTAAVSKVSEEVAKEISDFKTKFEKEVTDRKAKSDEYFEFLQQRKKQVNEIFGAIGSASLAGHFKNTADKQEKAANRLRLLALVLMLGTVSVAIISFYHTLSQTAPDLRLFGFRLATSLVLLIPAPYAARESAKHRAREGRLRKSDLELASIDAYLALLPEAKRNELKEKLTDKFFGQAEPIEKDEPVTGHALLNLLENRYQESNRSKIAKSGELHLGLMVTVRGKIHEETRTSRGACPLFVTSLEAQ
jgi:uncharacterized coiled-coil protein SlyX